MKTLDQLRYEFGGLSGGTLEDHVYDYLMDIIKVEGENIDTLRRQRRELTERYEYVLLDADALRKKLEWYEDQWLPSKQELVDDLNEKYETQLERANRLEEWITEYRDQLKSENAFHKNTGIINSINGLLNEV